MKNPVLIAEVKGVLGGGRLYDVKTRKKQPSLEDRLRFADSHGDWVAIHTSEPWGGSWEWLSRARSLTTRPILAKGPHCTDDEVRKAIALGAQLVLVLGRVPKDERLWPFCLFEPWGLLQLAEWQEQLPAECRFVWNTRDVTSGEERRLFGTAREIARGRWLCQASLLSCVEDVQPGADAVVVGSGLKSYVRSAYLARSGSVGYRRWEPCLGARK